MTWTMTNGKVTLPVCAVCGQPRHEGHTNCGCPENHPEPCDRPTYATLLAHNAVLATTATRRHRVPGCDYCDRQTDDASPPHEASLACESGNRNHCTCDWCY